MESNEHTLLQSIAHMKAQLRRNYLYMLVHDTPLPQNTWQQVNVDFHFHFQDGSFFCFILSPESRISHEAVRPQWLEAAQQSVHDGLSGFCHDFETILTRNKLYCVANTGHSPVEIAQRLSFLLAALHQNPEMYTCQWTLGLGRCVSDFATLTESKFSAQHALKFSVVHGTGVLYDGNRQNTIYEGGLTLASAAQKISLQQAMQKPDTAQLSTLVEGLFESHLEEIRSYPVYAYMLAVQIIQVAMQALRENMPVDRRTYELQQNFEQDVDEQLSLSALVAHTTRGVVALSQRYKLFLENGRSKPLWLVINYIQEHYTQKISLNELARCADRNPQYISAVFSRECGMSISEYITSLRIEKAKQLLRSSSVPIAEIASSVGYQDARYFSRIFQKESGISPRDYRKHTLQGTAL